MPVITISAVNTTTDTLTTATPHGLLTGDRTRVRNVGGALPAGLTGATDLFAIRVDATNLKIATTNPNALAGTAINITTAGSGTNTIEYGLPYCVPRVQTELSQVHSADFNSDWQAMVALYGLLTGQAQSIYDGITLEAGRHITVSGAGRHKRGTIVRHLSAFSFVGSTPLNFGATAGFGTAGSQTYRAPIVLSDGERLESVTVVYNGSTGSTTSLVVNRQLYTIGAAQPSVTQIGATANSGSQTGGLVGSLSVSGLSEVVGSALASYWAEITQSATGGTAIIGLSIATSIP